MNILPSGNWDETPDGWKDTREIVFCGPRQDLEEERHIVARTTLDKLRVATVIECKYDPMSLEAELRLPGGPIKGDVRTLLLDSAREVMNDKRIVVDLTTLPHPFYLALLKSFTRTRPKEVACTYVEPKDYENKYDPQKDDLVTTFTQGFHPHPSRALPLLAEKTRQLDTSTIVPFLGFDGLRLKLLLENETFQRVIPAMGFPAYRPGWHIRTIHDTHVALRGRHWGEIHLIDASSPFEARDLLLKLRERNPGTVRAAILGTRPHSLGALLAHVASNEEIAIVYDAPMEIKIRTQGVSKFHVYDVTHALGLT